MIDFAKARAQMVDSQLRTRDVTDARVLAAFLEVPREHFVPEANRAFAYIDKDVPLGEGRFLMAPTPFARLVQLAGVRESDRVLDVASGTGYGAAILARLAGHVVGLDDRPALVETARRTLADLGVANAAVEQGPLPAGRPQGAPFDVILFEGAVDEVPGAFFDQLADGGRLVAVLGRGRTARATLHVRTGHETGTRPEFDAAIASLPDFHRAERFEFAL